jgi:hypothetical protein
MSSLMVNVFYVIIMILNMIYAFKIKHAHGSISHDVCLALIMRCLPSRIIPMSPVYIRELVF